MLVKVAPGDQRSGIRGYSEESPQTPFCEHKMGSHRCLHNSVNKGVYQTHVDNMSYQEMINIVISIILA